jgi:mono/diheme cytochrome c family protein
MRLFKQLLAVFTVLVVLIGALMIISFDVIKIDWVSFMEIQSSYGTQEDPLPVPAQSIPIEGPAYIPGAGAPANPVPADAVSIARGAQLFGIHCLMCHGETGEGNGSISAFLIKQKPANLLSDLVQDKDDGTLFLTISNGSGSGYMPALNENLTVRERWDLVNFLRDLRTKSAEQ